MINKITNSKIIIIVIICILSLCMCILTIYKYYYKKDFEYQYNEVSNVKKLIEKNSIEDYKDKIVEDRVLYNYKFSVDDNLIFGNIYIGTDGKLYIVNERKDIFYKVSDITFRTLFVKKEYSDGLYLYLISTNNELYLFSLATTDIKDSKVEMFYIDFSVQSFVNIEYKNDNLEPINSIFVLSTDNIIYDAFSSVPYSDKTLCLDNRYLIYEDNTISDIEGNVFSDINGKEYKIKYLFYIYEYEILVDSIIITEDDKLIYLDRDEYYIVEAKQKIKNIEMKDNGKDKISNLKIIFEDNLIRNYEASYGEYFGFVNK